MQREHLNLGFVDKKSRNTNTHLKFMKEKEITKHASKSRGLTMFPNNHKSDVKVSCLLQRQAQAKEF